MGDCFFGGMADPEEVIKVTTSNGGIMGFNVPVTVSFITNEFPGHAIFRSQDLFWKPLGQFDELVPGKSYYLLPLTNNDVPLCDIVVRQGHIRCHSVSIMVCPAPYRMSLDYQHEIGLLKRSSIMEPFYGSGSSNGCRFWKVKLVITPEQLVEMLLLIRLSINLKSAQTFIKTFDKFKDKE